MDPMQRPLSLAGTPNGPLASDGLGTGVALFHGFTSGPVSVTAWAHALARAGAHVRVPLLPGHGTRWEDLESVTAADWRRAARDTVDELLAEHDRVVVAGLSMGGALALDAAAHRPVAGAVVVNPGLRFAHPAAPLAGLLKHVLRTTTPIANDTALPGVDERAYPRTPVAAVEQVGHLQAAVRRLLPRVSAPVLGFRSTVDHVVPDSAFAALRSGLAPGLLTARMLEDSHHVATMDRDAGRIEAESVEFIASLPGRRGGHRA